MHPLQQNILKYIIAEAKEKKHAALQKGWKMTVSKVSVTGRISFLEFCMSGSWYQIFNRVDFDSPLVCTHGSSLLDFPEQKKKQLMHPERWKIWLISVWAEGLESSSQGSISYSIEHTMSNWIEGWKLLRFYGYWCHYRFCLSFRLCWSLIRFSASAQLVYHLSLNTV